MGESCAPMLKKVVYGPVASWRLGRSLGIDLLCRPKTCSFDCVYCQLGSTLHKQIRREEFVPTGKVVEELDALPPLEFDYLTFSGMGEPTLASNLEEVTVEARCRFSKPIAVLTNSSLLGQPEVRAALSLADVVVAKLDAPDAELFRRINRPANGIHFEEIIEGLRAFRAESRSWLAIQVMFCQENRDRASEIASLVRGIGPDEVQLNTPLRPSGTAPLPPQDMRRIRDAFAGLPVSSVYEAGKVAVHPLDGRETAARRPEAGAPSGGSP